MTDLSLTDLATDTGVTPRTVRYYIAQGLLPAPVGQGSAARYTDRHAARIRLIKRLQREHLPLAEIRTRLATLDDGQVRRALDDSDSSDQDAAGLGRPADDVQALLPGTRALQYIRRVLDEGNARGPGRTIRAMRIAPAPAAPFAASRPAKPGIAPGSVFEREIPDAFPMPDAPARRSRDPLGPPSPPASFPAPGSTPAERSTWERIGLTPDIEVHVRRPLDRQANRQLDRLLAYARELLSER
jgi:DNA-binding transcriptional MerR regulator